METRINVIVNSEVIAYRNEIDAPLFISQAVSAHYNPGEAVDPEGLQQQALAFVGEQLGVDPAQMTVVRFAWSELEHEVLPPLPPECAYGND